MGKGFGFLFEMGCGKTLTAIAVTGAGYKLGKIKRVLIVAPTSVCAVWPKEFADYADFRYTVKTLLGTKPQRLKTLADLEAFPFQSLKVAVINYESTWRDGIFEKLMEYDADLIIAATHSDEVNMVTCQMAHSVFQVPRKIARLRSGAYLDAIYSDLYRTDHLPIDVVISPEREVARAALQRLSAPSNQLRRNTGWKRPRTRRSSPSTWTRCGRLRLWPSASG